MTAAEIAVLARKVAARAGDDAHWSGDSIECAVKYGIEASFEKFADLLDEVAAREDAIEADLAAAEVDR